MGRMVGKRYHKRREDGWRQREVYPEGQWWVGGRRAGVSSVETRRWAGSIAYKCASEEEWDREM